MAYRVGIVGAGFGGNVHAPAYRAHPAFQLVAIASPHKATTIVQDGELSFPSLEAMLDGVELDVAREKAKAARQQRKRNR